MKVESVSVEISASSQKWTPDGGRDYVFDIWTFSTFSTIEGDFMGCCDNDDDDRKEKSSAVMVKADLGQRRRSRRRW